MSRGLLVINNGQAVRVEGVAQEEDGGMLKVCLGDRDSGAVTVRDHRVLVKRDGAVLVAVYQDPLPPMGA